MKAIKNKRKHKRFRATAFLNMPVVLKPLPPFFGRTIHGRLIDLSAGGMALLIEELIPQKTKLSLTIGFPDRTELKTFVVVRHATLRGRAYIHGFEFINLPSYLENKIDNMSNDYIDCETRIQNKEKEVCRSDCAFYNLCAKPQKKEPVLLDVNMALELAFKTLDESPLNSH